MKGKHALAASVVMAGGIAGGQVATQQFGCNPDQRAELACAPYGGLRASAVYPNSQTAVCNTTPAIHVHIKEMPVFLPSRDETYTPDPWPPAHYHQGEGRDPAWVEHCTNLCSVHGGLVGMVGDSPMLLPSSRAWSICTCEDMRFSFHLGSDPDPPGVPL